MLQLSTVGAILAEVRERILGFGALEGVFIVKVFIVRYISSGSSSGRALLELFAHSIKGAAHRPRTICASIGTALGSIATLHWPHCSPRETPASHARACPVAA